MTRMWKKNTVNAVFSITSDLKAFQLTKQEIWDTLSISSTRETAELNRDVCVTIGCSGCSTDLCPHNIISCQTHSLSAKWAQKYQGTRARSHPPKIHKQLNHFFNYMSCATSNHSRTYRVSFKSPARGPREISLERRNQKPGLGLIYKHQLKANKKARGDQALSRFTRPGVSCPIYRVLFTGWYASLHMLHIIFNCGIKKQNRVIFLQMSLFSVTDFSVFSSRTCSALPCSLQSIWRLWAVVW